MSSEKLGGWHLTVDLANYVFEGRNDEILGDWGRAIAFFGFQDVLSLKNVNQVLIIPNRGGGR